MSKPNPPPRGSQREAPPDGRWARAILHVDMDAFFAAVEVLDRPELRGKPVIVGGTPEGHGVVSTASYEARRFGVHSAMPAATAVRLCPRGVFLRPRMERYEEVSRRIFEVLGGFTPLLEPLSIDEAFLDLTGCPAPRDPSRPADEALAAEIQARVEAETGGLTCSAGLAENKFVAKVASDLRKPRGLVVVPPGNAAGFLAPLEIERLWGVGPRTAAALRSLGLETIGQVARVPEEDLARAMGTSSASHLHALSLGLDDRPVVTDWERESVSHETTFGEFLAPGDREAAEAALFWLSDGVAFRLRQEGLWGRTVHLKVRDDRFRTVTRSLTVERPTQVVEDIFGAARGLLRDRVTLGRRRIRLLGVGVTGLTRHPVRQLDLLEDAGAEEQARLRASVADAITRKLGEGTITRGRLVPRPRGPSRRDP